MILGPADDRVCSTVHLAEPTRRHRAMQDEHWEVVVELRALQRSTTHVQDLVLKGSDKTSSLAVSLSLAVDLIEGHINDVAANKVGGGGWYGLPPCHTSLSC
jgi:hypothetical protein